MLLFTLFFSHQAFSYHFFEANTGGCKWASTGAGNVDFLVDGSSSEVVRTALLTEVTEARDTWNNLDDVLDVFGNFTSDTVDYTDTNFGTAWGVGTTSGDSDGQNEVVLDETGDIFTNVFSLDPANINGFGPSKRVVSGGNCTIVDAFNLLNGTRADFDRQSTTVHEFGHIQGLAHSSVGEFNSRNVSAFNGGYGSPSAALDVVNINDVPTMHPFSSGTGSNRRTPEIDDNAGLRELYPDTAASAPAGSIRGTLTKCSDDSPIRGVNIRAVNRANASIQVTRYTAFDSNGEGRYEINGLPPGSYNVIVEPMGFNGFTKSRMAIQTSVDAGFPTEYYGPTAEEEAACTEQIPDEPLAVNVADGSVTNNINIKVGAVDLAFVVDDTGSMGNEISAVRDILNRFINILESLTIEFPTTAIVTFKDNVTLRRVSNEPEELRAIVNSLVASGGADCPESSNAALFEAGRLLRDGGVSVFFTDADSRPDGPDRAAVRDYYRSRSMTLSAILSSTCSGGFSSDDTGSENDNQTVKGQVKPASTMMTKQTIPNKYSASGEEFDEPPTLGVENGVVTFAEIASLTNGIFETTPRPYSGDVREAYINTGTNISLSSVIPAVGLVTPNRISQGATAFVELTGSNTNWNASSTVSMSLPPASGGDKLGVTSIGVISILVNSPTSILAELAIPASEVLGFYDVTVSTDLGGGAVENSTGFGALQVSAPTGGAEITAVTPSNSGPGQTLNVIIDGLNTAFVDSSTVEFLSGFSIDPSITVNSVTLNNPHRLTVNITIANDAGVGLRDVRVDGAARADDVFLVAPEPAPFPQIMEIIPNQLEQGSTNTNVVITGANTHFSDTSTVSFSGTAITVNNVAVSSATQLTATVSVDSAATLGFRDVLVTTGDETAVLLNGLQITEMTGGPPPQATLISPNGLTEAPVTYRWNAVETAAQYQLWVQPTGKGIPHFAQWFTSADAGCGDGVCEVTPEGGELFGDGSANWWILTWNEDGVGPWSEGMTYRTVEASPPDSPTLYGPSGDIAEVQPLYGWSNVDATWYYLWVDGPRGNVIKQWYRSTDVGCLGLHPTCTIQPEVVLGPGAYRWWIQGWNSAGYGAWSEGSDFNVVLPY